MITYQFPQWLKKTIVPSPTNNVKAILNELSLNSVCQSARCPNMWECFNKNTVTFLILGKTCTRHCSFCSINSGFGEAVDATEPQKIAYAIKRLKIKYAVITSVSRDDLKDKGAGQFKKTVEAIRRINQNVKIEVLVPDFAGQKKYITLVISASPDVFAHNIETVPRLYKTIRPQADYNTSLDVLMFVKQQGLITKSGILLGFGEKEEEVLDVFYDLKKTGCDILTVGQYLRPSLENIPVQEFILPQRFQYYKETAEKMGFRYVQSGPFVRSSYKAEQLFN